MFGSGKASSFQSLFSPKQKQLPRTRGAPAWDDSGNVRVRVSSVQQPFTGATNVFQQNYRCISQRYRTTGGHVLFSCACCSRYACSCCLFLLLVFCCCCALPLLSPFFRCGRACCCSFFSRRCGGGWRCCGCCLRSRAAPAVASVARPAARCVHRESAPCPNRAAPPFGPPQLRPQGACSLWQAHNRSPAPWGPRRRTAVRSRVFSRGLIFFEASSAWACVFFTA